MKTFLFIIALMVSLSSFAQKEIKLEEVKNHVGDSVLVEGKIYGVKVFVDNDKKPTLVLLNLGAEYPNQLLTIAVHPFKDTGKVMPNESFKGDIARVKGRIETFKGKLQMVVYSHEQIAISSGDAIVVPRQ